MRRARPFEGSFPPLLCRGKAAGSKARCFRPPARKRPPACPGRGLKPLPGRARRSPRRPSETAGALHLKEHRGRRLLMPAAAPFREVRRAAVNVNAGPGICAREFGVRGGGGAARERPAGEGLAAGRGRACGGGWKINEGTALCGFAGFQKADEFGEETHPKGARLPAAFCLPSEAENTYSPGMRSRRPGARANRRDREILMKKEKMP